MTFIPDKLHLVRAFILVILLRFFTVPIDFNGGIYFLGCLYLNLLEELSPESLHFMYQDISNFMMMTRSVAFEFNENQLGRIAAGKSNFISLKGVINSFSLSIHSL